MMLYFFLFFVVICAPQVESYAYVVQTPRRMMIDGNWLPTNAFGTYASDYNDRYCVRDAVIDAIEAGYRHIDTAPGYLTEDMVGEAIANVTKRGLVRRTDLFICTKLPFTVGTREQVVPAVRDALKRLQTDYVDIILIKSPHNVLGLKIFNISDIWSGLVQAKWMGLTRSIGVSNFNSTNMAKMLATSKTVPAMNQIETNPTFANQELVAYCQRKGIIVTGYAAFGFLVPRPFNNLSLPPTFDNPILVKMAKKYGVTVSQIVLRYLVDRNIIPISASLNEEHIKLNANIFDFTLTPKDILIINEFDRNIKVYPILTDMRTEYNEMRKYILKNNLQQYENITTYSYLKS